MDRGPGETYIEPRFHLFTTVPARRNRFVARAVFSFQAASAKSTAA